MKSPETSELRSAVFGSNFGGAFLERLFQNDAFGVAFTHLCILCLLLLGATTIYHTASRAGGVGFWTFFYSGAQWQSPGRRDYEGYEGYEGFCVQVFFGTEKFEISFETQ